MSNQDYNNRYSEVSEKLKKMNVGSDSDKDKLVSDLKKWLSSNKQIKDKGKIDAINNFLAENGVC
jgi:hypothetical protein